MWDTEHNNGVLIYLLLAERSIEIVADRGIDRRVPPQAWQEVVLSLAGALRAGKMEEGLCQAVDAVAALLQQHFPLEAGEVNPDERPDAPAVNA